MIEVINLTRKNITDFALLRNRLLNNSKAEWVLFLDNDEVMETQLSEPTGKYSAYYLTRKNYFLGKYVGSEKTIRLIKKGSGIWVRRVHEIYNLKRGKAGFLKNIIIHHTADKLSEYLYKINKYSSLHAQANCEERKKSTIIKIVFYPQIKFILTFLKSGNIVFSIMQSLHSFLSWTKLYFLQS